MNETTVTIVGNISSDLTSRRTVDGSKVVNFAVIANERRFDRETETWVDGHKLHAFVTCWRKLALAVAESLKKGDPVIVTGRLYQESYEVQGETRSALKIEAQAVGPNLNRCTTEVRRGVPTESDFEPRSVNLDVVEGEREPAFAAAGV